MFHFSGHGSQILDRDRDELKDHMDELICPWDMNWDNGYITDDMLRGIFDKLSENVLLEVILDCCHSGSGTRNSGLERPAELGPEYPLIQRFLPPPLDVICRHEGEEHKLKSRKGFKTENRSTLNHVLWAGCKDYQTSADAPILGSYNGAFTYNFCMYIRESGGNIKRNDLLTRVTDSLSYNNYSQTPQLETPDTFKDNYVFLPEKS